MTCPIRYGSQAEVREEGDKYKRDGLGRTSPLCSICIWGLQVIHLCLCFDFFHYVSVGYGLTTWSVNSWRCGGGRAEVALP